MTTTIRRNTTTMLGMFTARQNRERLQGAEATVLRLERRLPQLSERELEDLEHAREVRDELAQWLEDLARIEGR